MAKLSEIRLLSIEEDRLLSRLVLNAHLAARVCGVSPRQLTYWSDLGLVPAEQKRGYGVAGLHKAKLIRQALEQGFTLRRAARLVEDRLAAAEAERSRRRARPVAEQREEMVGRLDVLIGQVRRTRQSLLATAGNQPRAEVVQVEHLQLADLTQWVSEAQASAPQSLALRLNHAIDELANILEQLTPAAERV